MIRTEKSKKAWQAAQAINDFETMDKIELEWDSLLQQNETYYDNRVDWDSSSNDSPDDDYGFEWEPEAELEWTNEDEAGLEEHEESKRRRIAEQNEY